MSKTLSIATCQHPVSADIMQNLSHVKKLIRQAARHDADIVHFSECNLSGYGGFDLPEIRKEDFPEIREAVNQICTLAGKKKIRVILGSHHFGEGMQKPFNSLYLINEKGEIEGRYDKRLLAGMHGDRDPEYYFPGSDPFVFEINGFKCGLLICHEWRYPELYRQYYSQGVDIVFQSWYDGNLSREEHESKGRELGELITGFVRGNAANNCFWISGANCSTRESSFPAFMVQPDGRVLHSLKRNRAGLLLSKIDKDQVFVDPSSYNRDLILKNQ